MRIGIIAAYLDHNRTGLFYRGSPQPQAAPLIAAMLPANIEIDIVNETLEQPDWQKHYDLLFITSLHSDFDRARQLSHYWRQRGAKTIYGGPMASAYPSLCSPFFDAVAVGDAEGTVHEIYTDFCTGELRPFYVCGRYDHKNTPVPRFDLMARQQIPISFEATRGCPFTCDFCALTGAGTRFHPRPTELVVRDIQKGQEMLRGQVSGYKLRTVVFSDNNIGGNPSHLRALCASLKTMDIWWASAATFNVMSDPELVSLLSQSGCRAMFVGLESFNPAAIADMSKKQNNTELIKGVVDQSRKAGILIFSGMLISPTIDDCRYIESIPGHLKESGLHVPGFVSFECPIPGTPYFHRLANQQEPAFLPNALLRDFTGYALTVRPRHESVENFIKSYVGVVEQVYSSTTRITKFLDDLRIFASNGFVVPAILNALHLSSLAHRPHPDRTYLTGTDVEPIGVSNVPFEPDDFCSESERQAIMEPMRVTDAVGHVLPIWRESLTVFKAKGRVSPEAAKWSRLASETANA